jgi:hypothetical protein
MDMSCYVDIRIQEDTPLTQEALAEVFNQALENAEFMPDWDSTCAGRIASVQDEKGNFLVEDMAIEPSPFDAGRALQSWLRGHGPNFQAVINSAAKARLINEPVMEVHRGTFKLPGAKVIDVDFEVRKGATREEKDLAFLEALAQIGTVDYVAIGDASCTLEESCHE